MKYLIGFLFGVMVASASAESLVIKDALGRLYTLAGEPVLGKAAIVMTARDPDGNARGLKVDADGFMLCSPSR